MADATSPSPSRKNRFLIVGALLLAALGSGVWWWARSPAAADAPAASTLGRKGAGPGMAVAVGVAAVVQQDAPLQISALGTVAASNIATVRARVDGLLEQVYFQEGQRVQQGQLLATLDARAADAALQQAQGQLQRDQALLQNAKVDLQRYQELLALNSIARQQVDTQAALVKQYEGTVRLDQGSVANAQLQRSYTRITAPTSGWAGLRQADPGNMVHASDANGIVVITQTQPANVLFALPETSLARLQKARQANPALRVEAWDRDSRHKLAEGTLLALDNQINTTTGTVNLKARFANTEQQLFPNQFVNVRLNLGVVPGALMVPSAAVQIGKAGSYVYRVNDDQTVSVNTVQTGETSGGNTLITQGLQVGQTVVVDGLDKLRDGARISRVDRAGQAAATDASDGKARRHRPDASPAATDGASAAAPAARKPDPAATAPQTAPAHAGH